MIYWEFKWYIYIKSFAAKTGNTKNQWTKTSHKKKTNTKNTKHKKHKKKFFRP